MSAALSLRGVTLRRGARTVLDGLDFTLAPGELVALLGRNGAGKTSLLRIAGGIARPDAGTVTLGETPLDARPRKALARELAYLPQAETGAQVDLDVRALVALGRMPHGSAFAPLSSADRAAIDRAIADVDLVALGGRAVSSLSAGERQRALLGRVFAQGSPVLLLDEPTANLDASHAEQLLAAVRARLGTGGAALVAMHDVFLAARIADRVLVLDGGKIVRNGPPATALDDAALRDALGMTARLEKDGAELVLRARVAPPEPLP